MNCPECGASVSADDRFCGNCGALLDAPSPDSGAGPADTLPPISEDQPGSDLSATVEPAGDAELPPNGSSPPASSVADEDQEPVWKAEEPLELSDASTSVPGPSSLPVGPPPPPPLVFDAKLSKS